jgi:hypothetical protein
MTLFVKDQISTYHIHIPRTGGRFVTQMLRENNYELFHCDQSFKIYGYIPMHMHYPLYEWFDGVEESIQFTVVRNPYDRFVSSLTILAIKRDYSQEYINNFDSYDFLKEWLEKENILYHYHNNWFRPQNEFLNEKVSIWKFENKLGKDFIDWISNLLNENIERKEYSYYGDSETETNEKRKEYVIPKNLKKNIELYYAKDYEILGY